MNQKGFSPIFVILGIILIIGIAGGAYYFGTTRNNIEQITNKQIKSTTVPSNTPIKQQISQEKAAQIVQNLPEVKNFLSKTKSGKIALNNENTDQSFWSIHVYENLSDRLATFNWYDVDKSTGKVTPEISVSTNETEFWKTYTNDKYGIQFSYPSNLKSSKDTSDNGVILVVDFSDGQDNGLQVWAALSGGVGHGQNFSLKQVSESKVKVNNNDATLTIWETDPSSSLYSMGDPILRKYSVVLDNKPVIIEFTGEKTNTSIAQLNQILSTFKFIR